MKNFLLLISISIGLTCIAQSTSPRYSLSPLGDNTGRVLTYGANTITPTGTLVSVVPSSKYYNCITVASTSLSPTFTMNVTNGYLSDNVDLILLSNSTGSRVVTFSTNITGNTALTYTILGTSATTVAVPTSKQALFSFKFDGAKYVWVSQSIQP